MNTRIKELYKEATEWCEQHAQGTPVAWEWEEKFAELIIAECAKIVNNNDFDGSTLGNKLLFEHFGFEQLQSSVVSTEEQPYIETTRIVVETHYNSKYGDDRICVCGDPYYRHFDTYEDMYPCGCKYCDCYTFKEREETHEQS